MTACTCGHAPEEHGGDPKYPGSSACQAEGCDCIAFEEIDLDEGRDDAALGRHCDFAINHDAEALR